MIRTIVVVLVVSVFLILSIPFLLIQWIFYKLSHKKWDWINLKAVQIIFRILLRVAGVDVTVLGKENIPADQSVLYVGNHRSYFDILVGYATVPSLTGFVAKKEMEKIPILAQWMLFVNCLFLDRVNLKEGLKTILQGIEKVKKGTSIWIFPEGTRSETADITELLPFKEGSLKIAEKSGCPIIPVAILGTAEVFEQHLPRMKPSKVTIIFGEPIIIKSLEVENKKFLGAYTRDIIIEMLREHQGIKGEK